MFMMLDIANYYFSGGIINQGAVKIMNVALKNRMGIQREVKEEKNKTCYRNQ